MGRNVRAEESRAEMVLGRGVPDPYTLLLYSKIGVYRGLHYVLIFAIKRTLWVLVRRCIHNLCFEQKNHNYSSEKYRFYSRENCCILHGHVIVM